MEIINEIEIIISNEISENAKNNLKRCLDFNYRETILEGENIEKGFWSYNCTTEAFLVHISYLF